MSSPDKPDDKLPAGKKLSPIDDAFRRINDTQLEIVNRLLEIEKRISTVEQNMNPGNPDSPLVKQTLSLIEESLKQLNTVYEQKFYLKPSESKNAEVLNPQQTNQAVPQIPGKKGFAETLMEMVLDGIKKESGLGGQATGGKYIAGEELFEYEQFKQIKTNLTRKSLASALERLGGQVTHAELY